MSSLKDSIAFLESDLKAVPPRINVYHDLPFAILRYDPADEWNLRREIKLLVTRLEAAGKDIHIIPMSELLWSALDLVHEKDDDEGLEAVISLEKHRGYVEAQQQVTTYLSSRVCVPLWDLLAGRLTSIDPENSVVFLTRVAVMSPGIFHMSMLLDKMHGKTKAATILFYPGSIEGQSSASDDCVRMLAENGPDFGATRDTVRKLREWLNPQAISLLGQARLATGEVWQRLAAHSPSPELADTIENLKSLLSTEQFIESWTDITNRTRAVLDAYRHAYSDLFDRRRTTYEAAIGNIKNRPEWEPLAATNANLATS